MIYSVLYKDILKYIKVLLYSHLHIKLIDLIICVLKHLKINNIIIWVYLLMILVKSIKKDLIHQIMEFILKQKMVNRCYFIFIIKI